jgi:hypothetical protein
METGYETWNSQNVFWQVWYFIKWSVGLASGIIANEQVS